jgi:hypothetical protein
LFFDFHVDAGRCVNARCRTTHVAAGCVTGCVSGYCFDFADR